jgi:Single Cache domain 2
MYYSLRICYLCLHRLGTMSMRYLAAFVILASLVLPPKSATANVLSPADYESFHNLDLKMLPIGDDLYALITNRPGTHAPDCLIELAFKFDAVQANLHTIGTLVGLAASMTDNADELRVIHSLSLAAWGFLEQLKYHRLILNSIVSNCAEDQAVAKSQEISRTWSDASSLVQSIVKKIGVISSAATLAQQFGTAAESKAMLAKTVSALKADKAKTLDEINKGEGGFLDRDLYPFCFNLSDGKNIAVASPNSKQVLGTDVRTIKDPTGKVFGPELYAAAQKPEGEITEVNYMWPRPGSDKTPVAKVSFVTKVGDLGCGVGYYK